MADELVVVEQANILALFQEDGCDPIIAGLKKKASEFKGDITTSKGRDEIRSFARKFSSAKVYMDKLGKKLSDDYRAKIAPINAERNKIEVCCNELRDQVRKPLTDWEDAEKKRVADIEERITFIGESIDCEYAGSYDVDIALKRIKAIVIDDSFDEFELAATKAKQNALERLEAKFIVLQNAEKEKAEADRIEKEQQEKDQKEREEKIAKEAAEKATKDAEEKAKKEAEEKERKDREEKERLEKETLQAKLDKETAEREKRETEEKSERDKKEALEKAEADKKQAIEDERKRQEEAKRKEDEAEEKRQSNKRHRKKINNEAKESLRTVTGCSEEESERIIVVIAKGQISNVSINY